MKKLVLLAIITFTTQFATHANDLNTHLFELAKIYRNFMFRNDPVEATFQQLKKISTPELSTSKKFIKETITKNNQLTTTTFLKLPDEQSLKYIYIIRRLNWNLREESPKDNNVLISELSSKETPRYELIDSYYDMLFCGVGNKNRPFNLSNTNFVMSEYGLKDDTEKGIFFLKAADLCGTTIWGYMNIVKPPNYKTALELIEKYPKFNGQPYYQYLDFGFPDFEMEIDKGKGEESYKSYYINKFYDTLLSHLACLSQKKKYKEARTNLLLGSILKEENYYKYSKKKEVLESLFTKMKK